MIDMIDRSSLITGSLVMFPFLGAGKMEVYRVTHISDWGVELEWRKGDKYRAVNTNFDELIPIEITPEILEKNGFVQTGISTWELMDIGMQKPFYYYSDGKDGLLRYIKKSFETDDECGDCYYGKYLHELQYCFRAANINKEVTI